MACVWLAWDYTPHFIICPFVLVVMVVFHYLNRLYPCWNLCPQHVHLDQYHRSLQIVFTVKFSPGSCGAECVLVQNKFYEQQVYGTVLKTLSYCALVKVLRNSHFLLHVKFLMVVTENFFSVDSWPLQKPFSSTLSKNSEDRSLKLRLRKMKNNTLLKFMSFRGLFLFHTAWKRFIINRVIHCIVLHALLPKMQFIL